jgi:acetyl esterase/lipase
MTSTTTTRLGAIWAGLGAALSLSLGGCAPVSILNGIASASSGYAVKADIPYGDGPRRKLDVYTPEGTAPAHGWPLVVFFYGGSWDAGSRQEYRFVGAALAARGVMTIVPDYRLYPEVRYPDFLKDSAMAMAYGLSHAGSLGADAKRVFVMGHSAGGYNAAMVALDPRWLGATGHKPSELAGFIGLAGAYNVLPTEIPEVQSVFLYPDYPRDTQPLSFASAAAPRTFLGIADHDTVVDPTINTRSLANKLVADGVPVTLKVYERPSHATLIGAFALPIRWIAPVLGDVTDFIDSSPALP